MNKNQWHNRFLLELRTYQRHIKRIGEEDKAVWYSIIRDELATELLRLRSSLEETYLIAKGLAEDPQYNNKLEALQAKDDARLSIVHLLTEGPEMMVKVEQQQQQPRAILHHEQTQKHP